MHRSRLPNQNIPNRFVQSSETESKIELERFSSGRRGLELVEFKSGAADIAFQGTRRVPNSLGPLPSFGPLGDFSLGQKEHRGGTDFPTALQNIRKTMEKFLASPLLLDP